MLVFACLGAARAATVVVVSPHPDDESLIAAGRIRAAIARGDVVKVVIVTNGDYRGVGVGLVRQGESVGAIGTLGLAEPDVIFLGYGDGSLAEIARSAPGRVVVSPAGQTSTWAQRGLGGVDYHRYVTGASGPYTRATLVGDLVDLFARLRPDEVITTTLWDEHGDHRATSLLVTEALVALARAGVRPRLLRSLVWAPGTDFSATAWPWAGGFTPGLPFYEPPGLDATPLDWQRLLRAPVPPEMTSLDPSQNLKAQAIGRYATQDVTWLLAFARKDESAWLSDLDADLALVATVRASAEDVPGGNTALRAVDAIVGDGTPEWVAPGQRAGAYLELAWGAPVTLAQVNLADRIDPSVNVTRGTLSFSDGSTIAVGPLPPRGRPLPILFPPKRVTWARFTVDAVEGGDAGLAEIEALGVAPGDLRNHAPHFVRGPVGAGDAIDAAAQAAFMAEAHDLDGDAITYQWRADGGAIQASGAQALFTAPVVPVDTVFTITARATDARGAFAENVAFVTVRAPGAPRNLAPEAAVRVSSENAGTGQLGRKAVDGVVDGYPGDWTREWATRGELAGAWIQLDWANPVSVGRVVLHDRPNGVDRVLAGTLLFSDGTSVVVGALPNGGGPLAVDFVPKVIGWVRFRVDAAVGQNIGLAEIEVFGR